jgi:hypothetical protein
MEDRIIRGIELYGIRLFPWLMVSWALLMPGA